MKFAFVLLTFIQFINSVTMKTSSHAQSTIIEAVRNNQLETVKAELKKGVNVNATDKRLQSLLLIATHDNNIEMAKLLVSHGADVNQQDNQKDSPFLYAGASGYTVLVKLFLDNGARFDIFNRYHGSALIPACERAHLETVQLLANTKGFPIDHINRLGWTALIEAVVLGDGSEKYVKVVQMLVSAGCNINISDKNGVTALQHAKANRYHAIVTALEKK